MLFKTTLLNIAITTSPKSDIFKYIKEYLDRRKIASLLTIVTPNPEQIVYAQKDERFRDILNNADIALPDGVGLAWANKIFNFQFSIFKKNQKFPRIKTIPGIDFMEELVRIAAEKGYTIGLIGGRERIAQKALINLQKNYPGLKGWAEDAGEFRIMNYELRIAKDQNIHNSSLITHNSSQDDTQLYFEQLAKRIKDSGTKIVFIGFGAPKQEYFMKMFSSKFDPPAGGRSSKKKITTNFELRTHNSLILMSVGGAFDIFSGKLPRAPYFIQQIHLEWLWRLLQQPWRIGRQINLTTFIYLVLRNRK